MPRLLSAGWTSASWRRGERICGPVPAAPVACAISGPADPTHSYIVILGRVTRLAVSELAQRLDVGAASRLRDAGRRDGQRGKRASDDKPRLNRGLFTRWRWRGDGSKGCVREISMLDLVTTPPPYSERQSRSWMQDSEAQWIRRQGDRCWSFCEIRLRHGQLVA